MITLNDNKSYKSFVNQRDEALERILFNTRHRISDKSTGAFNQIVHYVQNKYRAICLSPRLKDQLYKDIATILGNLAREIQSEIILMRMKTYLLTVASESKALQDILVKKAKTNLSRHELYNQALGGDNLVLHRAILVNLTDLEHKIISAVQKSCILGFNVDQALGMVVKALPKKVVPYKKKALSKVKKVQENDSVAFNKGPRNGLDIEGFEYDEHTWDQILTDYEQDYIPVNRSPQAAFSILDPLTENPMEVPPDEAIYLWQIEQEVTHDFVSQVRLGQVDAANKYGIDEFVWIAIIDGRTCENCCEWRNGLLTSEIEAALADDHSDDECDAIVPPAHFNCRCTIAPASSDLSKEDLSSTDTEFEDWLKE